MTGAERELIDFLLNEVVLLTIAYVLALVGFSVRRLTGLGRTIGANELTFAVIYLAGALAAWLAIFASEPWRYIVRLAILVSAVRVLLALRRAYGGWRALHEWAWEGAKELAGDVARTARWLWGWLGAASPWRRFWQGVHWLGRRLRAMMTQRR